MAHQDADRAHLSRLLDADARTLVWHIRKDGPLCSGDDPRINLRFSAQFDDCEPLNRTFPRMENFND